MCFRLVASLLLLGPITFDMLRLSNRFAGPVFRMQRELKQIAQGGKPEPIRLRDNDYWHDFADDLNAALCGCLKPRHRNLRRPTKSRQRIRTKSRSVRPASESVQFGRG